MKMTNTQEQSKKRFFVIAGSLFVIVVLAVILNSTNTETNIKDLFFEWILFTGMYGASYYLFFHREKFIHEKSSVKQFFLPVLFVTVFWDMACLVPNTDKSNFIVIYGFIALNLLTGILLWLLCLNKTDVRIPLYKKILEYLKNNKCLMLICILFVVGSAQIFSTWLNQDGIEYYNCLAKLNTWNFTDLQALQMATHHTELYTMMLMIGEFLLPGHAVGVRLVCIMLGVLTIIAFDSILKVIFKENYKIERIILTGIFAFSPYLFGLLAELNTDFPLLCFFVWMVLFHLKERYIMQAFCGLLLCFTKEPGCLLYGAYILGIVVNIIYKNRKNRYKMMDALISKQMLINYSAGILWIFYFVGIQFHVWAPTAESTVTIDETAYKLNSFSFWGTYILYRLKELFVFNYAWIFWSVIIVGGLWSVFHYKKTLTLRMGKYYVPLIFSFAAFLFISTGYITYPHIRYNIPVLFFQCLFLGVTIIYTLKWTAVRKTVLLGLLMITVLSNYVTDPLTINQFFCYEAGNGKISCPRLFYSVDGYCYEFEENKINYSQLNEGTAYNRQYLGRAMCLEQLLEQVDYSGSEVIVIPDIAGNTDMLYRHILLRKTAWAEGRMYWNTEQKRTNANFFFDEKLYEGSEWKKINTVVVEHAIPEELFDQYERVFYLQLPINEDYDHKSLLENYVIDQCYTAQNGVWEFEMLELKGKKDL